MIAEDASTPTPTHQAEGSTGTCASASFTPPANSLVVVNVVWMFGVEPPQSSTLSVTDNHSNTYAKGVELDNVQETDTAIYLFYYSSAPGATTVTVTCTSTAPASVLLAPRVLTGANSNQSGAASATDNDDGKLNIATTTAGSWAYVVAGSPVNTRPPVADVTLTQIDTYNDSAGTQNQSAVGRLTSPTRVPGRTWTGWTANMAQASALEILPAAPILLGNGGQAGPSWQTGQVLASADCNTWLVPLVQQKTGTTPSLASPQQTLLQTDPDLQLPFLTAGNWAVRGVLVFDGPSSANLKFTWTIPAGASFVYMASLYNTSGNFTLAAHVAADVVTADTTGVGSPGAVHIDGTMLMGSTPGSLTLQWAQNAAASTPDTMYQCSYLLAWRLG